MFLLVYLPSYYTYVFFPRNLKRELELALKNCRVLQFKLKKAEKTLAETNYQKENLEKR